MVRTLQFYAKLPALLMLSEAATVLLSLLSQGLNIRLPEF